MNKQIIIRILVIGIIFGMIILGFSGTHWVQSLPQRTFSNYSPETGSTGLTDYGNATISYYHNNGNDATVSQIITSSVNTTSTTAIYNGNVWSGSGTGAGTSFVVTQYGQFIHSNVYMIKGIQFPTGYYLGGSGGIQHEADIGTAYANLTVGGSTFTWSHTFNAGWDASSGTPEVLITPVWTLPSTFSQTFTTSYTLQLGATNYGTAWTTLPGGTAFGTRTYATSGNATNVAKAVEANSENGFAPGWYYPTIYSESFTLPSGVYYYKIMTGSTNQYEVTYKYNGLTVSALSGFLFTGSTPTTLTMTSTNDVPVYDFTAYFDIAQVTISTSTTSDLASTYSISAVPGTTNEFNSSGSFAYTVPSNADIGNSSQLITYSVNIAHLEQQYYSSQQAYWEYTFNSGSYTAQSNSLFHTISGSFTNTGSDTVTFSTYEYANNNPSVVSSHLAYTGTGSEVKLFFNLSSPIFTGETQTIQITWGDGDSTTLSSTSNYNFLTTHSYQFTGNYIITVATSNNPSPSGSGGLSSLNAPIQTYKYNVRVTPTVSPISGNAVTSGTTFSLSYTAQNDFVSNMIVNETANGVTQTIINDQFTTNHAGQQFTFQPSYAGTSNFILTITFDGAKAVYTYNYVTLSYPTNNSNFLVVQYGKTLISGLQLTITNPTSVSTGNYLQEVGLTPVQLNNANNTGFTNIAFYYTNGTPVYSWLQDVYQLQGASPHAQGIWWLRLNPIPAGGSVIVNVEVVVKIESLMNGVTIGEAPQLSPVYGEYNNLAYLTPYWIFTPHQAENVSLSGSTWTTAYFIRTGSSYGEIFENNSLIIINMTKSAGGIMTFGPNIGGNKLFGAGTYNNMFAVKGNATSGTYQENYHSDQVAPGNWNVTTFYAPTNNNTWIYNAYIGSIWNISSSALYQFYTEAPAPSLDARLCVNESILFKWSDTLNATMPSVSITGISNQYANSTQLNNVHYITASAYQYNTTEWEYTYNIPNNNSNYVTVYYASSWQFQYGSPTSYIVYPDMREVTFSDMSTWSQFQVNFIEPITIANPYGLLTINYAPSTAIGQVAGIKIPFSELTTYVNGQQMPTDQYQYVIGTNLNIITKDIFNQTVSNVNVTPQTTEYSDFITIPVSQLQIANLNSTYYVSVYIKQNGIFQALTTVMPLQTVTDYLLSGTYNFSYQFTSINSNAVTPATYSQKMNISGLAVTFFNGMLFYGINQNLSAQRHNLSSLMTNITVTIDANNATIANLLTSLKINVNANDSTITNLLTYIKSQTTDVNSNVTNLYSQVLTNFTIVNSLIHNENVSIQNKMNFINTTLDSVNLNITNKIKYVNTLINSTNNTIINQLSIINSTLTHANLNITNKIKFTDSLLNNTNISIFNKIKYTDTIMNNTNFSIHNILNIENDTLNNVNLNITNKIKFTNSLLNNTNISIETKIGIVNTTLNAVNLNITTKIKYVDSLMNNTNVSITTKIGIVNDTLNNDNLNITSKINFTNSLLNNTNLSIQTKIGIVNDTLSNVNFNITTKIKYVNNLINSTTFSVLTKVSILNSTLNNVNVNITNKIRFTNSLLNNTNISIQSKLSVINSVLNNVNTNITTKIQYTDSLMNNTKLTITNKISILNATLNSLNINLTSKIKFVNSLINSSTINVLTKIGFVNTTLNNVNISVSTKFKYVDSLVNNTEITITTKLGIINSTLNNVNINITNKIKFTNSLLNNTNLSIQNKLTTINSVLTNVNVNITNKIKFTNSLLNSTTLSISNKIGIVNTTLNSVNLNITTKIKYVNSLVNSTTLNIDTKIGILNSTLNNVNINITNKIKFTNSLLNNTNLSIQNKLTVIDSVLTNVNTNITTKIAYTNSLLNNTKLTISNKLSIMNSTLNSLNVNLTTKINLVETSISNLNINDTTRFDILNSSLHSLTINDSQYFSLLNTSIVNMNFSVKSYFNLVNDSIHGLNLTLLQKVNILKSMLNNTNITMVQKFDMISSLIGTANININQSLIFSRDLIVQMELAYKLNIALNDYVMSGGSGIIYTSDGTFVSAYTNVLDPYEVIYATTYSNLTTNKSVIWFGNPTPYNVLSSIVIQGTPQIDLIGTLGKVNVSYYNLATGKILVSYTIYNMSSNQYSIPLSKTYLADGYAVKLNFSSTKNLSLASHVTWSGNSDFTWALNNITKTYSYTAKLPANKGYYGNVNTSTLGTTMNTTNQTENVLVGFPATIPVNTASVQVKDAQTGLYLTEGVNYLVSSNGVVFALNNYSARQYYITFKAQTNVSSDITQHLILGSPQSITAGASPLGVPSEYATAPFTNQQSVNNIYNFYLTAPTSNSILKAEVVINGVVVPANQVSIMGNLVFVSGIPIDSQQSVTIGVYYYAPTSSVTSLLFVNLIPSAPFAITPWLLVGFAILGFALIIVYNNDTNMSKIDGRGRRAVSAKDVNRYRGMMGIMFVFGLVWFIVMMLHLQGMI
ncbi:MAG: beta strand repeat-containing protein [Thermoplasmataceae archaeon]